MPELDAALAEPEVEAGLDLGELDTAVETETPEVETEAVADETEPVPGETTETITETPVEPGLEKLPKQYKDDKFVKGLYFANQKLREAYPGGVNEAIKVKQALDAVGGAEGLADFETQRKGWEQIDKDFAEGNPAVLEDLAGDSPEGFVKLMGPALDKLQKVDPEAYNHSLGKIFWNTMQQSGLLNDLGNLEAALGRQDVEGASAQFARVAEFLKTINGFASKVPEKKVDPEREKFQQERTAWEQQKQTEFQNNVLGETRQYALGKVEAQLTKEFSSRNLSLVKLKTSDPDSYDILLRNCYQAVNNELGKDKDAFSRFSAAIKGGKREDALKLAKSRIDAVFSDAVGRTYKAFYRVAGGRQQTQAAAATAAAVAPKVAPGTIRLSKVPQPEQLDKLRMYQKFGKDKTDSMIFNGKGFLKGKDALYDWN
jgi:hypothetical protein